MRNTLFLSLLGFSFFTGSLSALEGVVSHLEEKEDHYSFLVEGEEYQLMKMQEISLNNGDEVYIDEATEDFLRHYVGASSYDLSTADNRIMNVIGKSTQPWQPNENDLDRVFTLTNKFFGHEMASRVSLVQDSTGLESIFYYWFYKLVEEPYSTEHGNCIIRKMYSISTDSLGLGDQLFLVANQYTPKHHYSDLYPRMLTFISLSPNNSLNVYFKHNVTSYTNEDHSFSILKKLEEEPFKVWGVDSSKLHEGKILGWY